MQKREHSEKRVELKESGEMDVHIDVYRNTVQARFNASWFRFNIVYSGVRPLDEVIKELAKSVSEWRVVYSVKYRAEYKVYEREIYYIAVEFDRRGYERLEVELLTFEWPDRERLTSLISRALATIETYLNSW
ncbi:hypothetical protein [Pyrobaculum sp.]|uniref:hypothetical protein n=1 Tax=Pyrobaculum sp. TaxID=2004705 RepID=UPI003D13212B